MDKVMLMILAAVLAGIAFWLAAMVSLGAFAAGVIKLAIAFFHLFFG